MKKIILLSFTLCAGAGAFAQNQNNSNAVLPWRTGGNNASNSDFLGTTNNTDLIFSTNNQARGRISGGGDLIWDGGGKIRIGPTNPVANLMFELNGTGVVDGEFRVKRGVFVKALIQDLRPDTIHMDTNKVIHGDTRLIGNLTVKNDLTVGGNAKIAGTLTGSSADFSGTVFANHLRVSSLAGGATLSEVYADGNGNLKLAPLPGVILLCGSNTLNWNLGGNTIGNYVNAGYAPMAGTCDNFDYILKANNNPYLWIKSANGRVGIGTSSPVAKLDVDASTSTGDALSIEGTSGSNIFKIGTDGTTQITGLSSANAPLSINGQSGNLFKVAPNGYATINITPNNTPAFTINNSGTKLFEVDFQGNTMVNGNLSAAVGGNSFFNAGLIGTTIFPSPGSAIGLQVITSGSTNTYNSLFKVNNAATKALAVQNTNTSTENFVVYGDGSTVINSTADPYTNAPLTISNGGQTLKLLGNASGDIASSGSLSPHFASGDFTIFEGVPLTGVPRFKVEGGTGATTIFSSTSSSSPLLVLNGNYPSSNKNAFEVTKDGFMIVRADVSQPNSTVFDIQDRVSNLSNFRVKANGITYVRELFVYAQGAPFPDYVFEKDYNLMPLSEVKKYTELYKHLPNMPTAKEVETQGANIGEIQRASVEKIEELYRYNFELAEEIKVLKEEVKILKRKKRKNKSK